ncbi:17828_t:CDS:1, partial [Cetraspora pellucida]
HTCSLYFYTYLYTPTCVSLMEDLTSTYLDNSTSNNSLNDNITESSTNTEYITSKYWDELLHEDNL